MVQHCVNHSEKEALSFCRSCGEYFCSDCLNEGLEYFYCKKDECIKALNKELSQRKNEKVKNVTISKESKFIRRVAIIFILLSLVALIDSLIRIKNTMLFYLIPEGVGSSSHFFGFLVKYGWISLIVSLAIIIFSLFASIKIYSRKCRKLFLYALMINIFLICLYNLYIYTYYDFALKTSLAVVGYEGYKNYWSIEKYIIGIVSLIIIKAHIFVINKFSKENIKKEFTKGSS